MNIQDIDDKINSLKKELEFHMQNNRYQSINVSFDLDYKFNQYYNDIMQEIDYYNNMKREYYKNYYSGGFVKPQSKSDYLCNSVNRAIRDFYEKNPNYKGDIIIRNIDGVYVVMTDKKRDLKIKKIFDDE